MSYLWPCTCSILVYTSGAQSLAEHEDDCCISYIITTMDIRSCTRCIRVSAGEPDHQGSLHVAIYTMNQIIIICTYCIY